MVVIYAECCSMVKLSESDLCFLETLGLLRCIVEVVEGWFCLLEVLEMLDVVDCRVFEKFPLPTFSCHSSLPKQKADLTLHTNFKMISTRR